MIVCVNEAYPIQVNEIPFQCGTLFCRKKLGLIMFEDSVRTVFFNLFCLGIILVIGGTSN